MKLSKWIDGKKFKPAHVGVYQVDKPVVPLIYQYWNGKFMGFYCSSIEDAYKYREFKSCRQDLNFRGLAEKP